jgi:ADP-heptose:LPS heptosyltransferase
VKYNFLLIFLRTRLQLTSKAKFFIKILFYRFFDLFVLPSNKLKPKTLLLIRLDAIGDYVLFRNFIKDLSKSSKFKEFEITLLGNIAWKELSLELDNEFIDRFIWIDRDKFFKSLKYRLNKLEEVTDIKYETIVHPAHSREFFVGDNIVKVVNAEEKIGSVGDLSNIKRWQRNISDKYYTKLIATHNEVVFEFNRNREFFENILDRKLDIKKTSIILKNKKLDFNLPEKYAIFFIGASSSLRRWNIKNFAQIGKYLKKNYNYEIVLCGPSNDKDDALEFAKYFKGNYFNLVGKTSLVELLYVVRNGDIMISNETSAPHFAVALEVKNVFVLYNGNHYGRFTPYPKSMTENYHAICHPLIEKNKNDYKKLSNSDGFVNDLNIDEISVEGVIKSINNILG